MIVLLYLIMVAHIIQEHICGNHGPTVMASLRSACS